MLTPLLHFSLVEKNNPRLPLPVLQATEMYDLPALRKPCLGVGSQTAPRETTTYLQWVGAYKVCSSGFLPQLVAGPASCYNQAEGLLSTEKSLKKKIKTPDFIVFLYKM